MSEKSVESKYEFRNVGHQFYAVYSANIIMFSHGCIIGWVAPALPLLMSDETPLQSGPITLEQSSWIGSMNNIGALFGIFSFSYFTKLMGCKRAMTFLAIPALLFWLTIIFGCSVYHIYFARFMTGWTAGGILSTVILFVAEISDNKIRGKLGTVSQLARNVGMLLAYIIGAVLNYAQIPYVFIWIPIVYLITFTLLPNTPQYLIRNGQFTEAEKSLKFYKGCKGKTPAEAQAISDEFDRLKLVATHAQRNNKLCISDICERKAIKGLFIAFMLAFLNQMSGTLTFMTYSVTIFKKAGTDLNPNLSSIILAILQIVGNLFTSQLADKLGRKRLLIVSLLGCVLGLTSMAAFLYLDEHEYDTSMLQLLPVISLGLVIFFASMGILPLTSICTVEVLPSKIRAFGLTVGTVSNNIFAFTASKCFPILAEIIHMYGCMMIFATCCFIGIFVIMFIMDETNRKSLDTIAANDQEVRKQKSVIA